MISTETATHWGPKDKNVQNVISNSSLWGLQQWAKLILDTCISFVMLPDDKWDKFKRGNQWPALSSLNETKRQLWQTETNGNYWTACY